MEETAWEKVFLPGSYGRKWGKNPGRKQKILEEIHVVKCACKLSVGKKSPDTVK